jgi:hypothetical protein
LLATKKWRGGGELPDALDTPEDALPDALKSPGDALREALKTPKEVGADVLNSLGDALPDTKIPEDATDELAEESNGITNGPLFIDGAAVDHETGAVEDRRGDE